MDIATSRHVREDIRIHQHLHQFAAKLRKRHFCISELRSSWSEKILTPFSRLDFNFTVEFVQVRLPPPPKILRTALFRTCMTLNDPSTPVPVSENHQSFSRSLSKLTTKIRAAPHHHLLSNYHYSRRQSSR